MSRIAQIFFEPSLTLLRKITSSMRTLAWRNLVHDKVRLAVTVTGIVFAVVLIVVELGLVPRLHHCHVEPDRSFRAPTSGSPARACPTSSRASRSPSASCPPYSPRRASRPPASTPCGSPSGSARTAGRKASQVVGVELQLGLGAPWNVVAGTLDDLRQPDAVFIDEIYRAKLGVDRIGQVVEIRGRRARIAGFTRGIRAFTTSPYVFTTFKNAQDYTDLREDQTLYVLVKAAPGVDVGALQSRLRSRLTDVDVVTNRRLQPDDAGLLDVHDRRRHRRPARRGARPGRRASWSSRRRSTRRPSTTSASTAR